MRRALVALAAVLVVSLGAGASAQAKCGVTCLNHRVGQLSNGLIRADKKIATLSKVVAQQEQTIAGLGPIGKKVDALYECLREVPISEYGEPGGPFGYIFQFENELNELETEPTSALDVPFKGEFVGAWFLIDGCNTAETAAVKSARALLPPAPDLDSLLVRP